MPDSPYSVKEDDLKDPALFRLNSAFTSIGNRLNAAEGNITALQLAGGLASGSSTGASASIVTVHAQRSTFDPGAYPIGTFLVETDRTSIYQAQLVANKPAWVFVIGLYESGYTNLPGDLTRNDIGFQFFDQTHWRLFEWAAVGAAPASASPGWRRGPQELPTGFIGILPFGPGAQIGTQGWALCNGILGVSITQDDASIIAVDLPHFTAGPYPKGGSVGSYGPTGPTPNPAVTPTVPGTTITDTASAVLPPVVSSGAAANISGTTAVDGGSGVVVQSGSGTTVAAHTHTHDRGSIADSGHQHVVSPVDTGHQHTISPGHITVVLPDDPVPNIVVPFFMKR